MTAKRVDKLAVGEHVKYITRTWRVTRVRPGAHPTSRTLRLRDTDEPHDVVERDFPVDTMVEVVE